MGLIEILLLALALSADAFSVGAALGLRYRSARQTFRLAFHFGLFQALLPLVGALLSTVVIRGIAWVAGVDHWIACGLLAFLGARMIRNASRSEEQAEHAPDLTRGWNLVGFSVAVSIDAFAAGVTLPAAGAPIALAVTAFGVTAALATLVAIRLAASIARRVGSRVEVVAGIVLIGLGIKVVVDHLRLLG